MHEFSLYGQVPANEHNRMLQQLAGVTRMQPKPVQEIHLVFKSQTPRALGSGQPSGSTANDKQNETQRVMRMLSTGVYYVQIVGKVRLGEPFQIRREANGDTEMTNGNDSKNKTTSRMRWHLEFKDTPEAGKQTLSNRLTFRVPFEDGDVVKFMSMFGYDYVSRYMVVGHKFFDRDIILFLHKIMRIPDAHEPEDPIDNSFLDSPDGVQPLDGSGGYLLQTYIEAVDGGPQEVKDRAIGQLLAMKETLKQAVVLGPGDRLALDTKVSSMARKGPFHFEPCAT